jgi:hypothetical protein
MGIYATTPHATTDKDTYCPDVLILHHLNQRNKGQ